MTNKIKNFLKGQKIEWHQYTSENAIDCSPSNNDLCIIELSNGKFYLDKQSFGEWSYKNVIGWGFYKKNLLNDLFEKLI